MIQRKKLKIVMINKSLHYIYVILLFELLKKDTESKIANVVKTKNGKIMLLSKCAVCYNKKSKFIEEQEATGLLNTLARVKIVILSDLPIANILF